VSLLEKRLNQIAQRDYGVSLLGDLQKLPQYGPGHSALDIPA